MDWKHSYESAYKAANGHEATVVAAGPGFFQVRTTTGTETGCTYPVESAPAMTQRLRNRADAGAEACL